MAVWFNRIANPYNNKSADCKSAETGMHLASLLSLSIYLAFDEYSYLLHFLRTVITFFIIKIIPAKINGILKICPILKNNESSKPF